MCQSGDLLDRFGVHVDRHGELGTIGKVLHLKLVF